MTADEFFNGLDLHLRDTPFKLTKKTPTGRNIYTVPQHGVEITVNYVINENANRLSIKMTINRGAAGGPTPVFDAVMARHKEHARELLDSPVVNWSAAATKKESKVEVERNLAQFRGDAPSMYAWIVQRALVLKEWADEIE